LKIEKKDSFISRVLGFVLQKKVILYFSLYSFLVPTTAFASINEIQIEGNPGDDFSFANFCFWEPPGLQPNRILVVSLGTNQCGLHLVNDPDWQNLASSLNCGLLTCYFVGPSTLLWGDAARGSGRALVQSLETLAKMTDNPQLAKAPVFLVGNSQGGVFCYHFAAWKPERTLGFISLKGGYHDVSKALEAARVPGLFVIGELDEPFRIANIRKTFALGRAAGAPWCLANEPNSHHEPGPCSPLTVAFFQAVAKGPLPKDIPSKVTNYNTNRDESVTNFASLGSWFPNARFAKEWQLFQSTGTVPDLPKLSFASEMPPKLAIVSPSTLELASVPSESKSPTITLNVLPTNPNIWDHAEILPRDHLSDITSTEQMPSQASLSFRFDSSNLPLGQFASEVPIRFSRNGKTVFGGLNVPLSLSVTGDVVSIPPSIYIGPVNANKKITVQIKIISKAGMPIQFLSCKKSSEVDVSLPPQASNPLLLTFSFQFTDQDLASGVIILHLRSNKEWVLRIPYIGQYNSG
jgi:pimeloyl-ACP methyl ester carboxylesterase